MDSIAHRICLIPFLVVSFAIAGCSHTAFELKQEAVSPDGVHAVSVYTSDSGATSSVLTVVNIRPARDPFTKREERGDVFAAFHAGEVRAEWRSDKELLIEVKGQPRIMLKVVQRWEIRVDYAEPEKKEPNQPLQRNASTGSVSNFESPARRG